MTTNQTERVSDEELDQMIWKLERDGGMTPKMLSLMKELREVRRAKGEPVAFDALRDAVSEITGGLPVNFDESHAYKGHQSVPFMNFNSLSRIVERFRSAPPSPVVPDVIATDDISYSVGRFKTHRDCYRDGWNACRAAMQLSGNSEQLEPVSNRDELPAKCWCQTCRPVTMNDMRFVVCPECGNKRCPRANDHRNACTGSNVPGQDGSAYPAAPKELGR